MPEYLAPGVYVEETSFRAKSIEGVSTSTTAFAGAARRGPIGGTPELVTSFADFARIYGGLDDMFGRPNYLAHAVRAYFNEGGSRLYVSRAFAQAGNDPGVARADRPVAGPPADPTVFVARFPGAAGNGAIVLRQVATPATKATLDAAPEGSMMRTGGDEPATPARIQGGAPPFQVRDGQELRLTVNGADIAVAFRGKPAEARANTNLAEPTTFANDAAGTLQVEIGGVPQTIVVAAGTYTREEVVAAINEQILDGYARVVANKLAIGTERKGFGAAVSVAANPAFGFGVAAADTTEQDADNTVGDLARVTVGEIGALLAPLLVQASLDPATGNLVLATVATGGAATLAIRGGTGSAHAALGLAVGAAAAGTNGPALAYFRKVGGAWQAPDGTPLGMGPGPDWEPAGGAEVLTLFVAARDADGNENVFEGLGFDPSHPRFVGHVLAATPKRRTAYLEHMYALRVGAGVNGFVLRDGFFPGLAETNLFPMAGGGDGAIPGVAAYQAAFEALSPLEDVSIVAAPGHTANDAEWEGIQRALITFVSRPRAYQIAILDTPAEQAISDARKVRSRIDTTRAALYYPWITVANPQARPGTESIPREIDLPPSGFLAGIYARNDVERGVHKAPANEVVRTALRFESDVNTAEQDVLNPLGVNCLRFFPGRGFRVWGARTVSSDPEWKYVNVRRYFNYLERSVDNGTQWAVFEPNGEALWDNVRQTISDFLYNEWRNGALLGSSPKEAFFVRCDRSTMTQNDLDNGRLICLVGVAVVKPAEFVIFRIGQKTADARS